MRAERERLNAKIVAENLRLGAEARELTSEEELCYLILVSGGSCNVQWDGQTTLAAPGCALLLGPGSGRLQQAGSVPPELLGCRFPVAILHDIRNMAQRDYSALFEPGQATLLYGPVQWSSCLRTVLELMRKARGEQDYPGVLYLGLLLHYAEQEYRAESHAARPRNETVEQIWEVFPQRGGGKVLHLALLPQPPVPAGNGAVHCGLHQWPPHRGRPEAAGDNGAQHRHGGGADGLCQRRPFPACLPGDHGHRAAAIPEEPSMRQTALPSPSSLTTGGLRGLASEQQNTPCTILRAMAQGVFVVSAVLAAGERALSP